MQESIDFLNSLNLNRDGYIIVGCSGGPDSMCLLNILIDEGYKVVVAHVNHNIRQESTYEYDFLKKYCSNLNIVFEGHEIPPYKDKNESFYRKKRYKFYKDLCKKYSTSVMMTAHHGDDLIETVLMRITRGSNLNGYLGFKKDYDEYGIRIIKPLIFYNKDEILHYNHAHDIPYVLDSTNEEDKYTRNRYRHKVLPFLKEENPNIHKKYLRYSEELASVSDFVNRTIEKVMEESYKDNTIDLAYFQKLDDYLKRKELETILKELYRDDIDKIKNDVISKIISLIEKGQNFELDLPGKYKVKREYKKLKFLEKNKREESYDIEFKKSVSLPNGYSIETIDDTDDTSNYTIRLKSRELKFPLHIRSRKKGDKIEVKNLQGSKKISKIMIDEKVDPTIRDTYPVLVDDKNDIIWLPGLKKSKFDSELYEKYDIILKYAKKGDTKHEEK